MIDRDGMSSPQYATKDEIFSLDMGQPSSKRGVQADDQYTHLVEASRIVLKRSKRFESRLSTQSSYVEGDALYSYLRVVCRFTSLDANVEMKSRARQT